MCALFTHALARRSQTIRSDSAMHSLALPADRCSLPTNHPNGSCFAHFALCYPVCFHTNTTIKFCNPFVLITMQIAGGWGVSLEGVGVKVLLEVPGGACPCSLFLLSAFCFLLSGSTGWRRRPADAHRNPSPRTPACARACCQVPERTLRLGRRTRHKVRQHLQRRGTRRAIRPRICPGWRWAARCTGAGSTWSPQSEKSGSNHLLVARHDGPLHGIDRRILLRDCADSHVPRHAKPSLPV